MSQFPVSDNIPVPLPNRWTVRWRMRWLWYRSCYTFLWAHHPLCETFREGYSTAWQGPPLSKLLLRVSRHRGSGGLGCRILHPLPRAQSDNPCRGSAADVVVFVSEALQEVASVLVAICAVLAWGRCCRSAFGLLATGDWPFAFVVGAVLFVFWRYYFRLRQERRAAICETCHEYGRQIHCSGTVYQAACLSDYQEAATEILYASLARSGDSERSIA